MEQFDILDRTGRPIGQTANKGAALRDGEYYLGVHAYIYNDSHDFLVQQRALSKRFLPGGWDVHLGHVMAGESSPDCAIREIAEEIGLTVPPVALHLVTRMVWDPYHHLVDVYFVRCAYTLHTLKLQKDEVIGAKEVSLHEMLAMVAAMDYRPAGYREIVAAEIRRLCGTE